MGIYISSDGTEKETRTLNAFNLVNGLVKAVKEDNTPNIEALKAEMLERLDVRALDAVPEGITEVKVSAVLMANGEVICLGKTIGWFDALKGYVFKK